MANIAEISEILFEKEVLKSNLPVLLDFFAPWCGPCRSMAPILEDIAKDPDYKSKIKIVKINVDNNDKISKEYKVQSIPTLILFKDGAILATTSGAMSKSKLVAFLKEHNI